MHNTKTRIQNELILTAIYRAKKLDQNEKGREKRPQDADISPQWSHCSIIQSINISKVPQQDPCELYYIRVVLTCYLNGYNYIGQKLFQHYKNNETKINN